MFEGPEALRPYWPDFRYNLQDVSQLDESDIRGNLMLRAALLTFMRSFDPDSPEHLADIFSYLAGLPDRNMAVEFLQVVVIYISATTKDVTAKKVSDAINVAFKDDGGAIMGGFVQELIEQGKQEGRQALRNAILDLLLLRFDAAPVSITRRLREITDLEILRLLNRQAATTESLTDFEQYLNTL